DAQYEALNALLADIRTRHADVKLIRHSDIYAKVDGQWTQVKTDPGPSFDGDRLEGVWTTDHGDE
ncbi:MAG: hypothetical protein AAGK78_11690, partial [Planctomycetota bacterium]